MINKHEVLQEIGMIEESFMQVSAELEILKSTVPQEVMLRAAKHGRGYQYFLREKGTDSNGKYIRKKELPKAITLAQIEYDERLLKILQEAKTMLEKYHATEMVDPYGAALEQMTPGKRVLVKLPYISDAEYIQEWKEQEYEGLPFKEGSPDFYTRKGLRVRSKSEVMIADILDELSIPFLYEKPLYLKKRTYYPDFTLLNIKTRKEVYWEHFGMMDDREYRDEALLKIREYESNGLYQYDSVIWTFESGKYPMNTRDIRNLAKSLCETLGY